MDGSTNGEDIALPSLFCLEEQAGSLDCITYLGPPVLLCGVGGSSSAQRIVFLM